VFTVTHGNRLEVLADRLIVRLREAPPPPLVSETIVVQSAGMARWLSMRIACGLGVAANVRFPLPAEFLWETFRVLLPEAPARSPLEPAVAVWHLRAILERLDAGSASFDPLRDYLRDADERGCHELATRIADLYDQYLVYRPHWIARWEAGEDEHWQAALWRRLIARTPQPHRARVGAAALRVLAESVPAGVLPARVCLFGIPTLPPAELAVFRRLADHTDVHLFRLSPSSHYWDAPRIQRLPATPEPGHPLVAALGKQGRDLLDLLVRMRAPDLEDEAYVEPGDDSLLHALQTDLLTLRARADRKPVAADDRSLQIHVCHGPMREVEVLHDQLLWLFEHHADVTPADVVVMMPDVETYAPCIETVFGGTQGPRHIPFTVADRSLRAESPLVEAFLALLELPGGRYEADRLLALLDTPAVHRRFGLAAADLDLVQRLVRESAVRWGVDAATRARLGLPPSREHTWRLGLDRLLLGLALPSGDRRMRDDVLPCDAVEGHDAEVLGRFATFVEAAVALDEALAAPRSPASWAATLMDVLARFIEPDDDESRVMQTVRVALEGLADATTRAGYDAPITLDLVRVLVRRALERPARRGQFLAGGVTFCAMMPMRSIPFEVVCVIGMNDGSFPRGGQPASFDLMAAGERQPGDRARRDDDRYLFLEAVCSARRCFYVSYVGRGIRDNAPIPPSSVVHELRAAVERGFDAPALETVHPLQAFSPRYFRGGDDARLVSYSAELCEASRRRGRGRRLARLVEGRLPDAPAAAYTLDLERLLDFITNPTAYLVRERLGMRLAEAAHPVEHRERFVLDALAAYTVRTELLARRGEPHDETALLRELRTRGLMPLGQIGVVELGRQEGIVEAFADRLTTLTAGEPLEAIRFEQLPLGRLRLSGELHDVAGDGLIGYRIAEPTARDRLRLWIRHLLLHAVRPRQGGWQSTWLGTERALVFDPVGDALDRLRALADLFHEGLHRLLPLFAKTSLAWCKATRRRLEAARAVWEGNDFFDGERADPYLAFAWRDVDPLDGEFERLAADVMGPLVQHCREDAP
jgi:exodeoxyribonuclease V gamma subunit